MHGVAFVFLNKSSSRRIGGSFSVLRSLRRPKYWKIFVKKLFITIFHLQTWRNWSWPSSITSLILNWILWAFSFSSFASSIISAMPLIVLVLTVILLSEIPFTNWTIFVLFKMTRKTNTWEKKFQDKTKGNSPMMIFVQFQYVKHRLLTIRNPRKLPWVCRQVAKSVIRLLVW